MSDYELIVDCPHEEGDLLDEDGWEVAEIDEDGTTEDGEEYNARIAFRHEDGAEVVINQWRYESYGVFYRPADGEKEGQLYASTMSAAKTAELLRKTHNVSR